MMLIAASCPSNSEAAVTTRSGPRPEVATSTLACTVLIVETLATALT